MRALCGRILPAADPRLSLALRTRGPAFTLHRSLLSPLWRCAAARRLRFYSRRYANHPSQAANSDLALAPLLRQPLTDYPFNVERLRGENKKGKLENLSFVSLTPFAFPPFPVSALSVEELAQVLFIMPLA